MTFSTIFCLQLLAIFNELNTTWITPGPPSCLEFHYSVCLNVDVFYPSKSCFSVHWPPAFHSLVILSFLAPLSTLCFWEGILEMFVFVSRVASDFVLYYKFIHTATYSAVWVQPISCICSQILLLRLLLLSSQGVRGVNFFHCPFPTSLTFSPIASFTVSISVLGTGR